MIFRRAVGGAGRVAEQVASGYLSRGHEVSVITTVRSKKTRVIMGTKVFVFIQSILIMQEVGSVSQSV